MNLIPFLLGLMIGIDFGLATTNFNVDYGIYSAHPTPQKSHYLLFLSSSGEKLFQQQQQQLQEQLQTYENLLSSP